MWEGKKKKKKKGSEDFLQKINQNDRRKFVLCERIKKKRINEIDRKKSDKTKLHERVRIKNNLLGYCIMHKCNSRVAL